MQASYTEENYLKSIFHLSYANNGLGASTNYIAAYLNVKPATATNMLQKLSEKKLISYKPYSKVLLTKAGEKIALQVIRKHRLWEVFLVNKLAFTWDTVHDVAEQLEHISSDELINRLEAYLQYPSIDPHGDPIPDKDGNLQTTDYKNLTQAILHKEVKVVAVNDTDMEILKYIASINITLGTTLVVEEKISAADTYILSFQNKKISISAKVAKCLLVI
jgi:DtxR family transcriptional regulator, Mn-dependent transcriptional regulator